MTPYRVPDGVAEIHEYTFGEMSLRVTATGRLDRLLLELKREFPKLVFQRKRNHWFWRALGMFLLIVSFGRNKTFLERFTTTIGNVIAFSDYICNLVDTQPAGWEDELWTLLCHEREHLLQFAKCGVPLMFLLYVFVFFPIGLAWFRAVFERAGYLQTLRCWAILNPDWVRMQEAKDQWVRHWTGPDYLWMWPYKGQVSKWYDAELAKIFKS